MEHMPEMTEGAERAHAIFAPSGMKANLSCLGKVAMEWGLPESNSEYSAEGSLAHEIAATCLTDNRDACEWVGQEMEYQGYKFTITEEFAEDLQVYIDAVRNRKDGYELMGATVTLMVEVKVPIWKLTGEAGAKGTSDVIMLVEWGDGTGLIEVIDLKFGRGVSVSAHKSDQGLSYAFGARELAHDTLPEVRFTRILIGICQPRLRKAVDEWECDMAYLDDWAANRVKPGIMTMRVAIERKRHEGVESILGYLNPNESNCQFCKALATCPKAQAKINDEVLSLFEDCTDQFQGQKKLAESDLEQLERAGLGLELAEMWLRSVRAEIERRLLAGVVMVHHKLTYGRAGNRKYTDKAEAERLLRDVFRLSVEDAYVLKLIGPAQAERLASKKGGNKIGPRQWAKLQAIIDRADPKPSVALMTDEGEAIVVEKARDIASDFDDVSGAELPSALDELC